MLNQYPKWKYILLVIVIVFGIIFSIPNLYGEDPSVQVSHRSNPLIESDRENIENILKQYDIPFKSVELHDNKVLARFNDEEIQLKASDKIESSLDNNYLVALNLAPATPDWLRSLNASPMYLGLDLRGGIHFLMEVDMPAAINRLEESLISDMRSFMREEKIRYRGITQNKRLINIAFRPEVNLDDAQNLLKREFRQLEFTVDEEQHALTASLTEVAIRDEKKSALQQNIITLRNRVNELGVAEPVIQQQGESRIVIQLPGVQDSARAKVILGGTATLEFRLAEGIRADWVDAENSGRVPLNALLYHERNGDPVLLSRRVVVTGDQITGAASTIDQEKGVPAVVVTLDGNGARKMNETTKENIGRPMAVVFIENRKEGEKTVKVEEVINVATIQGQFSSRFQITGLESQEARDLSLLLRAGSLKAPIEIVEERTIGPSLGKDNINQGFLSVVFGFFLVLIFMVTYYKTFGLIANIALTTNLVLLIAMLSLLQATLTLPGIAGIVLTVGMAVDANVLIFERIREELRGGNSVQASIHAGYEKAFSTILDANVTTFIAAIVLFGLGTGPVKGFAVTLSIGIITSMFTAIMGTRAIVNLVYGNRNIKTLSI